MQLNDNRSIHMMIRLGNTHREQKTEYKYQKDMERHIYE